MPRWFTPLTAHAKCQKCKSLVKGAPDNPSLLYNKITNYIDLNNKSLGDKSTKTHPVSHRLKKEAARRHAEIDKRDGTVGQRAAAHGQESNLKKTASALRLSPRVLVQQREARAARSAVHADKMQELYREQRRRAATEAAEDAAAAAAAKERNPDLAKSLASFVGPDAAAALSVAARNPSLTNMGLKTLGVMTRAKGAMDETVEERRRAAWANNLREGFNLAKRKVGLEGGTKKHNKKHKKTRKGRKCAKGGGGKPLSSDDYIAALPRKHKACCTNYRDCRKDNPGSDDCKKDFNECFNETDKKEAGLYLQNCPITFIKLQENVRNVPIDDFTKSESLKFVNMS